MTPKKYHLGEATFNDFNSPLCWWETSKLRHPHIQMMDSRGQISTVPNHDVIALDQNNQAQSFFFAQPNFEDIPHFPRPVHVIYWFPVSEFFPSYAIAPFLGRFYVFIYSIAVFCRSASLWIFKFLHFHPYSSPDRVWLLMYC